MIGHAPHNGLALVPAVLFAVGLLIALTCGSLRERRRLLLALALGLGVVVLACLAGLVGKDYVIERNLLPALVPLLAAAAVGFAAERTRWLGGLLAAALCAYWLAFNVHVTRTPNLQRPDYGNIAQALGPARGRRAIVTWSLSTPGLEWYLGEDLKGLHRGEARVHEIDVIAKPKFAAKPVALPPGMHLADRRRLAQFTIRRFVSAHPVPARFKQLDAAKIGFDHTRVLLDGRGQGSHRVVGVPRARRLRHARRLHRARWVRHAHRLHRARRVRHARRLRRAGSAR